MEITLMFALALFIYAIVKAMKHAKIIVVRERVGKSVYIAYIIGMGVLIGLTIWTSDSFLHYLTGAAAVVAFGTTMFSLGITKDGFIYPALGTGIYISAGNKVKFSDAKNIRIEARGREKLIIRFIVKGSEQEMTFDQKDADKIKSMIPWYETI